MKTSADSVGEEQLKDDLSKAVHVSVPSCLESSDRGVTGAQEFDRHNGTLFHLFIFKEETRNSNRTQWTTVPMFQRRKIIVGLKYHLDSQ